MFLLYIDPGAGSMVIQAVLAAVLAVPFVLRTHLRRGLDWVRTRRRNSDEDAGLG